MAVSQAVQCEKINAGSDGEIGRRNGLKIRLPQGNVGSIPTPSTTTDSLAVLKPLQDGAVRATITGATLDHVAQCIRHLLHLLHPTFQIFNVRLR